MSSNIDFIFISVKSPSFNELLFDMKECERLGYGSIWLIDRFIDMYGRPDAEHLRAREHSKAQLATYGLGRWFFAISRAQVD